MIFRKTGRVRKLPSTIAGDTNKKRKTPIPIIASKIEDSLTKYFGNTYDLKVEDVNIGERKGVYVFLTSIVDSSAITEKLTDHIILSNDNNIASETDWLSFCKKTFSGSNYHFIQYEEEMIEKIVNGYAILSLDGIRSSIAVKVSVSEKRAIEEPTTQTIIRGPKEGFVEDIETNITLIRTRIRNPALRIEEHIIGSETSTKVYLVYLDGVINKGILEEIRQRIAAIKTNAIFDSSMVEEFIADKTFTPFPLIYNTERPDSTSAHILSGKVALLVDRSPFVLTMPAILNDFVTTTEDFYQPFMMGTFLRFIRYFAFFLALLLPSLYVAMITFHHEMIPTPLMISIVTQREGIPFPAVIEALMMEITFEILREAGVRMPRAVGGTISIVGGLVIGQAAVEAGIVSHIMVIIVALTAISSFVIPVYSFSIGVRLLRFVFIFLAGSFGFYGVLLGLICMVGHLASLRSFGTPYLAPFSPFIMEEHKDSLFRFPIWSMKSRPKSLRTNAPNKQPEAEPPSPTRGANG